MKDDMCTSSPTASNAELVRAARAGDASAWDHLVQRHGGVLDGLARRFRVDRETRDDALQTTWLRLVEHLDSLREPEAVGAWLATTLRRELLSTLRGRVVEVSIDQTGAADIPDSRSSPEAVSVRRDLDERTRQVVDRLPEPDRRLVGMVMAGRPYREMSDRLGMPMGSIGPKRARSLERLRCRLETVGIDRQLVRS